jgi:hypothetical protein
MSVGTTCAFPSATVTPRPDPAAWRERAGNIAKRGSLTSENKERGAVPSSHSVHLTIRYTTTVSTSSAFRRTPVA